MKARQKIFLVLQPWSVWYDDLAIIMGEHPHRQHRKEGMRLCSNKTPCKNSYYQAQPRRWLCELFRVEFSRSVPLTGNWQPTGSSCWPSLRPLGYTGFSEPTGVLHLPGTQDYSCAHEHTPLHKEEKAPCSLPTPPERSLGCLCIPVPAPTIYSQCCLYWERDNQGRTRAGMGEGVRQKKEGFQLGLLPLSHSKD